MPMRLIVALAIALWPAASAAQARERVLIRYGTVVIETIEERMGPSGIDDHIFSETTDLIRADEVQVDVPFERQVQQ